MNSIQMVNICCEFFSISHLSCLEIKFSELCNREAVVAVSCATSRDLLAFRALWSVAVPRGARVLRAVLVDTPALRAVLPRQQARP